MARQESDREDLLREATALVQRAELQLPSESEPFVGGFRRDGSFSLYCGGDQVVQFNTAGQLRRGYFDGKLLKADKGRLVWLTRERTADAVILLSSELTDAEAAETLQRSTELVTRFCAALAVGEFTLTGQVPPEENIVPRILAWQATLPLPLQIAPAPNAR